MVVNEGNRSSERGPRNLQWKDDLAREYVQTCDMIKDVVLEEVC